jgi:uncharacterized protein DUF5985
MGPLVYALCALTSLLCAVLLLRAYVQSRVRLLFWSGVGFTGLAISNALMFTDFVIVPDADLSVIRASISCVAVGVLLFGLLWEGE